MARTHRVILVDNLNVIVFSKDRAAQLDLFLTTANQFWPTLKPTVLYTVSDPEFEQGYQQIRTLHPHATLVRETKQPGLRRGSDFKKQLVSLMDNSKQYTVCFVDDVVFISKPNEEKIAQALQRDDVICSSLRMQPGYDWCYTANEPMTPPQIDQDMTWDWTKATHDWGYPMTVDGHVYRTADFLPYLKKCKYKNPNSLEAVMDQKRPNTPRIHCHPNAVILNNPTNIVQNQHGNRHGTQTTKDINTQFLAGNRIDPNSSKSITRRGPHTEFPFKFIPA